MVISPVVRSSSVIGQPCKIHSAIASDEESDPCSAPRRGSTTAPSALGSTSIACSLATAHTITADKA